jgi:hypothetical protein
MNTVLKNLSSRAKTESSRAKTESSHAKNKSTHAKTENSHAKTESTRAKTESTRAKTENARAKTESTHAKDESTHAKTESAHAKDQNSPFSGFINQVNRISRIKASVFIIFFTFITTFSVESFAQACTNPEGQIIASPVFVYDANVDSLIITVPVKNTGTAAFAAPFKITVYKNDVGDAKRYTYNYNSVIAAGETVDVTFGIKNFKTEWMSFDNFVIRINDNGDGNNDQTVCGSAHRDYSTIQLIASDDYMLIFNNSADNQFRVAINDILPDSYVSLTVNVLNDPVPTGTATVSGSTVFYTPTAGKSADTIRYRIHCGNAEYADTATIYIKIMDKTDNIGDAECFVEPTQFEWTIAPAFTSSQTNLSTYMPPVAGDLNGDKIPEILAAKYSGDSGTANRLYNGFYVYWGHDRSNPTLINTEAGNFCSFGPAIARIEIDGSVVPIVVMVKHSNGVIHAYNALTTDPVWSSDTPVYGFTTSSNIGYSLQFVDFSSDGKIELLAGNHIYDAATGKLLLDLGSAATVNKGHSLYSGGSAYQKYVPVAADLDGDGRPEYAAGNQVYSIDITNNDGTSGNTATLIASIPEQTFGTLKMNDGTTVVADINRDGRLDVFASKSMNAGTIGFFAWDVKTNSLIAKGSTASSSWNHGMPFIGNVDSDPELEILFTTTNRIKGFRYNHTTTFVQVYEHAIVDGSGGTGITLFDFNQDDVSELVYRDETNIRIMRAIPAVAPAMGTFSNYYTTAGGSGTCYEYPLVVDADNDGGAEIVTVAGGRASTQGSLRIYKSGSAHKWAPARRVWNQFSYNVVNVNEDLTIPAVRFNPATVFPGLDGQLGTTDDIQPYNNFLQQQTILNKAGTPYWEASDYAIEGVPTATYYPAVGADSLVISFCVKNYGDIQDAAPFHVSVYKNERLDGAAIVTESFSDIPAPGQMLCNYKINVPNVTATTSIESLHLWLNDAGAGVSVNPECDYTNGVVVYDVTGDVAARNDYASIFVCDEIIVPILGNDEFVGTTFTILNTPKYGTAAPSGKQLRYTSGGGTSLLPCEQTGNRIDTVHYQIASLFSSDEAYAVVKIYNPPEIILENACSANPKLVLSNSYEGFSYDWEYSLDGASGWTLVADNGGTELNGVKAGFYRVTINYDNDKTYQVKTGVKIVVNRITQLPGGIVWYDMSSNSVNINWQ